VPRYILEEFANSKVLVTQPRRVSSISCAHYMAKVLGTKVGGNIVGYHIGGDSEADKNVNKNTQITYVTPGLIVQQFTKDKTLLTKYTHIIIDEVHERDLETGKV
jgi:HrpA-like RNA helicase